jgi:hypothetical protein
MCGILTNVRWLDKWNEEPRLLELTAIHHLLPHLIIVIIYLYRALYEIDEDIRKESSERLRLLAIKVFKEAPLSIHNSVRAYFYFESMKRVCLHANLPTELPHEKDIMKYENTTSCVLKLTSLFSTFAVDPLPTFFESVDIADSANKQLVPLLNRLVPKSLEKRAFMTALSQVRQKTFSSA